jgi:hypothetical protein
MVWSAQSQIWQIHALVRLLNEFHAACFLSSVTVWLTLPESEPTIVRLRSERTKGRTCKRERRKKRITNRRRRRGCSRNIKDGLDTRTVVNKRSTKRTIHKNGDKMLYILGYDDVSPAKISPTFRRDVLLTGEKSKKKKQPARLRQQADLCLFSDIKTVFSSETSVIFHQAIWCHTPDDSIPHTHYLSTYLSMSVCLSLCRSISLSIYLSVSLPTYLPTYGARVLCCAMAAFQFLNRIRRRQDSLGGGSARHNATTYTHNNTNTN